MIYAEYPLTDQVAPPTYHGAPRKYGFINKQTPTDNATLQKIKQECGLRMNVGLLGLCLTYLQKQAVPTPMEALYLLDSLSDLYARRPETQTLAGFDTDDPDHVNALSALICRCRAAHKLTPPLMLRTVLDALHNELTEALPLRPHDADPAVHFQLCQATTLAALPAQGYSPLFHLDIGGTPWTLVCHAPHVENTTRAVRKGDTLCLLHGAASSPTPEECTAAQVLFSEIDRKNLRCVLPVEPQMLLSTSLSCVKGATINCAAFAEVGANTPPYPCDLVQNTPAGWLIIVASDTIEALSAHSASCGLTLTPFGRARSDRTLEFEPRHHGQQVRLNRNLLDAIEIACAYRLTETHSVPAPAVFSTSTPACLKKSGFGGCGQLSDGEGFPAWFTRSTVLSMDGGFAADALPRAIAALKDALRTDGSPALDDASLAIGIEITPTLSRTVLWQYILRLYHTLQENALPCRPIALAHKEDGTSQITLTLLCRKPYDHKPTEEPRTELLPLPYCSSAPHTDHPEVLIAHTLAAGCIDGMADTLLRHGGKVQTLRITSGEEGCTVLANAINQARLVLLVGGDPALSDILTHPRVHDALQALVERDGLCLAHGDAMVALCRTGLFPEPIASLPTEAPADHCDGAFPYPVGCVQNIHALHIPPVSRPLPPRLPVLDDDPSPDDPLLVPFRSLQGHPVLAITQDLEGKPLAVRLRGQNGHILAFADGFDVTHLQAALDYCR